jgi:hypothetical protein
MESLLGSLKGQRRGRIGTRSSRLLYVILVIIAATLCVSATPKSNAWGEKGDLSILSNEKKLVIQQDESTSTTTSAAPSSTGVSNVFQVSLPAVWSTDGKLSERHFY